MRKNLPRGPTASVLNQDDVDLILAAGGIKGFYHLEVVEEILFAGIIIGMITGASVGAIIATFLTNGYSPKQIKKIFIEGLSGHNSLMNALKALSMPDPLSFMIGGMLDLRPGIAEMVKEFNLKPNKRLRIVACDWITQTPVVFEGEDYDLTTAIAASCSLPGVFRPIWHMGKFGPQLLVDGAMYHHSPPDFSPKPAIFSTFRAATRMPTDWQGEFENYFHDVQRVFMLTWRPWTPFYHMNLWGAMSKAMDSGGKLMKNWSLPVDLFNSALEVYGMQSATGSRYVDPVKHLVIETGLEDVAGMYFSVSAEQIDAMGAQARASTAKALKQARAQGRIKLRYPKRGSG